MRLLGAIFLTILFLAAVFVTPFVYITMEKALGINKDGPSMIMFAPTMGMVLVCVALVFFAVYAWSEFYDQKKKP